MKLFLLIYANVNQEIDNVEHGSILLIILLWLLPEGDDGQRGSLGNGVRLQEMDT